MVLVEPGRVAPSSEPEAASRKLSVAMIGTRGVPAAYGGFETAVEEIGARLAAAGHDVVVYCRSGSGRRGTAEHRGMRLVHLPAVNLKAVETLSHSALSVAHSVLTARPDVAFVFNAANAPFIRPLQLRGIPVAVHVDGLEWKRDKWGGAAKRYYRWAEAYSVAHADALIADARGIVDYYLERFDAPTELISYGAPIIDDAADDRLADVGLERGGYHLVVARFEPENHVDVIVEGYHASRAKLPLVVVGTAPYAADYCRRIAAIAASDPRIRLLGGVYDQPLLDQLYANALSYLHGHSVGGTNPSLLRGMGAGTAVLAWDVVFNREVAGPDASFFTDASTLTPLIEGVESAPDGARAAGSAMQARAARLYRWDDVAAKYQHLALRLAGARAGAGV